MSRYNNYGLFSLAIAALAMFGGTANAATLLSESFESAPGSGYSLTTAFDDAGFDFFDRYAVPDNSNPARDDFQNGWDGGFGILGQDYDGGGGPSTVSVDIPGVGIAGSVDLGVRVRFGALDDEPNFDNYEAADGDGIEVFADIDGGGPVLIGAFKPDASGAGDLFQDTNLDGTGDGTRLVRDLASFTFLLSSTGNSLDLSIELTSTGSFEMLVLDDVRVVDDIPEPATGLLLILGIGAMLAGRRRA